MNEQWNQVIERWRDAQGRQARIEAERAMFALAMQVGMRALSRFREIPDDEKRELVGDAFLGLIAQYPNESWSQALFIAVLTNRARDVVKKLDHRMRRDAVRESQTTDEGQSEWDSIASRSDDFAVIEQRREARSVMDRIRPLLSQRDLAWFELVLLDTTHQEIAEQYKVAKAVVDKAMQRAWEKARAAIHTEAPR
jgi:DNA-directed RNA polymerase specialized sigma24 family protein